MNLLMTATGLAERVETEATRHQFPVSVCVIVRANGLALKRTSVSV